MFDATLRRLRSLSAQYVMLGLISGALCVVLAVVVPKYSSWIEREYGRDFFDRGLPWTTRLLIGIPPVVWLFLAAACLGFFILAAYRLRFSTSTHLHHAMINLTTLIVALILGSFFLHAFFYPLTGWIYYLRK